MLTGLAALVLAGLGQFADPVGAQTPSNPVLIGSSSVSGATLGIPRWKGYQSPSNPDKFWASFSNGGASNNMVFTTNGGASWSSGTITIDSYLDYHLSLMGQGDDLHFAFPSAYGIRYRRFLSPSQSLADADPIVTFSGTTAMHRPNVLIDNSGRIWVFSRQGGSPSENVRYRYSDNGGASWTSGTAYSTGASDIRIGSMTYVNGAPALVVLHLVDPRGYEYYVWNGSSFEARPDHSIYAFDPGYDRSFTFNQINDTTFHLVFGQGSNLRHVWKNYNGGTGSWNTSVIMADANNGSIDWFPISTVHGDDLYVFYCRKVSGTDASMRVFYRKWTGVTQSWGAEYQVSNENYARDPNTTFHVPESSDYIPVFWHSGTGPYNVYFSKIPVTPGESDSVAPGSVFDLGAAPGDLGGQVTLGWTAPGDDGYSGTVTRYEVRYSTSPLNESNWADAARATGPLQPTTTGLPESHTVSGLPTGHTLYFGLKAVDEYDNRSNLSNIAFLLVADVEETDDGPLLPEQTSLVSLSPNPFNSEARIEYQVSSSTPVNLTVRNVLGQRVTSLVDDTMPAGRHTVFWNGTNDEGQTVSTGVYFVNLITDFNSDTRKIVHLK